MNVQPYVDLLIANAPSLTQVVVANAGVTKINVSTAVELKNVLDPAMDNRVYNMILPQSPSYPNLVFHLMGSTPTLVDGFHTAQVDTYHLYIRDGSLDNLIAKVSNVRTAIEASTWSIEAQDMMYDFDDEQAVFQANIEITFTVLALAAQTSPAAVVFPVGTNADQSELVNLTRQREHQTFAIMLMSNATNIEPLRREVQGALLGQQVSSAYEPIEYQQGVALDGGGGLALWQEIYSDALYIQQL
ncbi:MAG: hypothetical protein KZQ95_01770 [Candidatus Thiodiazotropha sp. (ex Epidulcina cf. delphinae)]|nr:hypothetical protein [Candidatus Thiodiazotropha sp. (ex Epidulcina cf. delphinae)]